MLLLALYCPLHLFQVADFCTFPIKPGVPSIAVLEKAMALYSLHLPFPGAGSLAKETPQTELPFSLMLSIRNKDIKYDFAV